MGVWYIANGYTVYVLAGQYAGVDVDTGGKGITISAVGNVVVQQSRFTYNTLATANQYFGGNMVLS